MITISGYNKKPVIVREVGKVIDLLRSVGDITASVEVSSKYTITSTGHGLASMEVITINDVDYVILVIDDDNFTINAATGLDFTGDSWKSKAPYYLFGHPRDIVSVLADRNKSKTFQYQKYPLIALFQDFSEDINSGYSETSLNLIIANITKPTYNTADRYTNNFEPVLYPLWAQLERAFQISKDVELLDGNYSKIDRAYWGKEGLYGNEGNIFDDHIDAIEIENLNLRFKNICV